MTECQKCHKGFMTETAQYEVIIDGKKCQVRKCFCSNVMCDVNMRKYDQIYWSNKK